MSLALYRWLDANGAEGSGSTRVRGMGGMPACPADGHWCDIRGNQVQVDAKDSGRMVTITSDVCLPTGQSCGGRQQGPVASPERPASGIEAARGSMQVTKAAGHRPKLAGCQKQCWDDHPEAAPTTWR